MSGRPEARPQSAVDRRKVLVGAALTGAAAISWARMPKSRIPRIDGKQFEAMVPAQIGPWRFVTNSGVVLPPRDAFSDRLYDNLVSRVYADGAGNLVMLLIAYNNRQDGVLQIHRPEICYPAGGFALSPTEETTIPLRNGAAIPAQTFSATARDRHETVLYWTRVGQGFPRRWSEQRGAVISANLAGEVPDGLLFRISSLGQPSPLTLPKLKRFANEFLAASPPRLAMVLAGPKLAQLPPSKRAQEI